MSKRRLDGLCECGCGQATRIHKHTDARRGNVKGQPSRFLLGHIKPRVGYVVDADSGCWNWRSLRSDGRAASVYHKGRNVRAYVVFYERAHGPVPSGLVIHHKCNNPACVNPDHLAAVSQAVNTRLGKHVRLTEEDVVRIRTMAASMRGTDIARQYGVSPSTIWGILKGRKWRTEHAPFFRGKSRHECGSQHDNRAEREGLARLQG